MSTELPNPPTMRVKVTDEDAFIAFRNLLLEDRERFGVVSFGGLTTHPDPVVVVALLAAGEDRLRHPLRAGGERGAPGRREGLQRGPGA